MAKDGTNRGRKAGSKNVSTIDKEIAREALRAIVLASMQPMVEAQVRNAKGISHLMLRDPKTGKFERIVDEAGIDTALKAEGEAVWIYTKDPSVQAFTDLMNRTIDKPTEHTENKTTLEAGPQLERIMRGLKRANG